MEENCIEQMLEMEQEGEVYRAGRVLRDVFKPAPEGEGIDDPHALLRRIEDAENKA